MMTDVKEVNKLFKAALKNFKMAIDLAKKNIVVGEIRFPTIRKARKSRKPMEVPIAKEKPQKPEIPEKPKKIRKPRKEKTKLGEEAPTT